MSTTIDRAPTALEQTEAPADHDASPTDIGPPGESAPPKLGPMGRRRVLGLAVPIIGENLLQTAVGAVDTLMVARLGASAVAGVGISIEIVFFILATLSAVGIGATVLVSQAIGAADRERANRLARQALAWGLLLAIPVSILGFMSAPFLISLFGAEADVAEAGTTYLRITGATSVVLLLTFVCGAIFRGAGDSRTPLKASVVANVVNVVLAYGLIFGNFGLPRLEVAGSAWSTAIGRGVGAAILLFLLFRGGRAISVRGWLGWRPKVHIARQLMRLGVPAALEQMLMAAGFAIMVAVVAILGTAPLAAQQIGFTALSIAFLPGFGFAIAATALVGQSIGAGNLEDARLAARIAMFWSIGWMAVGGLLYFVFAHQVMSIFTTDQDVIDNGVRALRALSVGLPFWAIWAVNGGALRGSGDTRTPMIMSTSAVWAAVGLAYVLVRWFDAGLGLVWLTFLVTAPFGAFGNWFFLRRRLAPGSKLLTADPPPAHAASASAH